MSQFVDYLHEVFQQFGTITQRKMFGGVGIYHDGLIFGLVVKDVLYLKVDKSSKAIFLEHNLAPFSYEKNGKAVNMSYHQAPESIYEDPDVAEKWAKLAFEAALRSKKK